MIRSFHLAGGYPRLYLYIHSPWSLSFVRIDHDHGDDCDDADKKKTRIRVFIGLLPDLAYPTGLFLCFATGKRLLLAICGFIRCNIDRLIPSLFWSWVLISKNALSLRTHKNAYTHHHLLSHTSTLTLTYIYSYCRTHPHHHKHTLSHLSHRDKVEDKDKQLLLGYQLLRGRPRERQDKKDGDAQHRHTKTVGQSVTAIQRLLLV